MAQFINIEGHLINLDNVAAIYWDDIAVQQALIISFNVAENEMAAQADQHHFDDTPAARAAYEWLKRTCVATFTDEPEGEAQS